MARSSKQKRNALARAEYNSSQDRQFIANMPSAIKHSSKGAIKGDGKAAFRGIRQSRFQSGTTIAGYNQSVWINKDTAREARLNQQ